MRRSLVALIGLVFVAACGGATTSAPPSASQPGTSNAPAASPSAAAAGGIVTVGLYQEPDNLNPYLAVQTASRLVRQITLDSPTATRSMRGHSIPTPGR